MYLLYLDDAGSPSDRSQRYFVMAGLCVFERQTHWVESAVTAIAARFNPADPAQVELHGNPMRTGAQGWKSFPQASRTQAVVDALDLFSRPQLRLKAFACVVDKTKLAQPADVIPTAFEAIAQQFDAYLVSMFVRKNPQRGLVIFDKADFEKNLQALSHTFKHVGHAQGKLRNFAEVPLFIDSKASRLIQLADLVAHWTFRRYESLDARGFDIIQPYFHGYGGQKQGLCQLLDDVTLSAIESAPNSFASFPPPTQSGAAAASVVAIAQGVLSGLAPPP